MEGKIPKKYKKRYFNKHGDSYEIIEYFSSKNCTVIFQDGTVFKDVQLGNIIRGNVKNLKFPSLYGIGYIGYGIFRVAENSKSTIHYNKWQQMIERCYDEKTQEKHLNYKDCSVDPHWHGFQNFAQWMEMNFDCKVMKGWNLDKDILVKGNKIYSPETCCFVPQEINKLFIKSDKSRGDLPIGVTKHNKRYRVRISKFNVQYRLGTYDTIEEAFHVYKEPKEKYIKEVTDKWKDLIDPRVYEAMYNYEVEITD